MVPDKRIAGLKIVKNKQVNCKAIKDKLYETVYCILLKEI